MSKSSKIEWTDATFNPWRGCTKVSAGCANCYAENNFSVKMHGIKWGPKGTRVVASESMWNQPIRWDREAAAAGERRRAFCASLADVFEDWQGPMLNSHGDEMQLEHIGNAGELPAMMTMQDVRNRLFRLIDKTPNLDWQLLTKRPENIPHMIPPYFPGGYIAEAGVMNQEGPRPNLWLGVSVENQQAADQRIPHLLCIPAAVRFLSVEPLLGQTILNKYFAQCECGHSHGFTICPNTGGVAQTCHRCDCRGLRSKIHWVIVGGESGPHARPCNVRWIRSLVKQCMAAGVACFVKQVGANIIDRNDAGFDAESCVYAEGSEAGQPVERSAWPEPVDVEHDIHGFREDYQGADCRVRLRDKKGGDMAEWPVDLRVREFPEVNR